MATILIVDDDPQVVDRLKAQFAGSGHYCLTADNGELALELVTTQKVDLLVLDLMLPGVSGFEVCRRIRANSNYFTIPIVFLSGMCSEEEIAHGLAQGADDFIPKPLQVRSVVQRVESLLAVDIDSQMVDKITDLPGPKRIKLDVQRAIYQRYHFALVYIEMMKLMEFGRTFGEPARIKATRDMAHGMLVIGKRLKTTMFRAGHLGGGHFVCIMDPILAAPYCERVYATWKDYLPQLYESVGQSFTFNYAKSGSGSVPLLDTMVCITFNHPDVPATAQQLFEVLQNLRKKGLSTGIGGIIVDKRSIKTP